MLKSTFPFICLFSMKSQVLQNITEFIGSHLLFHSFTGSAFSWHNKETTDAATPIWEVAITPICTSFLFLIQNAWQDRS
jgi:hypothetical protein